MLSLRVYQSHSYLSTSRSAQESFYTVAWLWAFHVYSEWMYQILWLSTQSSYITWIFIESFYLSLAFIICRKNNEWLFLVDWQKTCHPWIKKHWKKVASPIDFSDCRWLRRYKFLEYIFDKLLLMEWTPKPEWAVMFFYIINPIWAYWTCFAPGSWARHTFKK